MVAALYHFLLYTLRNMLVRNVHLLVYYFKILYFYYFNSEWQKFVSERDRECKKNVHIQLEWVFCLKVFALMKQHKLLTVLPSFFLCVSVVPFRVILLPKEFHSLKIRKLTKMCMKNGCCCVYNLCHCRLHLMSTHIYFESSVLVFV